MKIPTGSQTVGPFFNFGLTDNPSLGVLVREGVTGEHIRVEFRVTDGDGAPANSDAMIEIWQADASGRYSSSQADAFPGFGRMETDENGVCAFETIRPGRVDGQAPHINVTVFARGLLKHCFTRLYFADEPSNAMDPVLALVPEPRRATLMARQTGPGSSTWRMEIRLQGEGETVFFDL